MSSSSCLHRALGGGLAADVILWRRKDATMGILASTIGTYLVFQLSDQTLLSFLCKVALLLTSVLFVWAKAAALLRRQLPPLPDMTISEETMNAVAASLRSNLNALLSTAHDVALGKETHRFLVVAASLWIMSIVGRFTDFITLAYACVILGLTIPALYEKCEYQIGRLMVLVKGGYERLEAAYGNIVRTGVLLKRKQC